MTTAPPKHTWYGKTGSYTYFGHPLGKNFKNEDGNYIYAKVAYGQWVPVYIGQGNLKDRSDLDSHHKGNCIRTNGATHFHSHLNGNESDRLNEEADLVVSHSPSCNG